MALIKGYKGEVRLGNDLIGEIKNYSLDIASDVVDTTTLGSNGWRRNTATLRGWSGSVTAHFDTGDTGQTDIRSALLQGNTVNLTFYIGGNEAGNKTFSGTAIVKSGSITNDVAGIVEISFSFDGDGELVEGVVS